MSSQTARAQGAGSAWGHVTPKGGARLCGGAGGGAACMVEYVFKEINRIGPFSIQTWTEHGCPLKCEYMSAAVCLLKASLGNALCVTAHLNRSCV